MTSTPERWWDHAGLPATVMVGSGVRIEDSAPFRRYRSRRQPGLILGDGVTVFSWSEFSVEEDAVLEIGQDSVLVGAVFMCAERIVVGRAVVISYGVTIADCDFHPSDPALRSQDALAVSPQAPVDRVPIRSSPVTIGDGTRIGIGAIILSGAAIGAGVEVAPGSVVTGSVPDGAVVSGNPGRWEALGRPE